jgi:calpain-15
VEAYVPRRIEPETKPAVNNFTSQALFSDTPKSNDDEYNQVVKRLEITQQHFWDAEFPPEWSSLWGFGEPFGNMDMGFWKGIEWKTAQEIYPTVTVFDANLSPRDIHQGYLGDCYFLSAVAALAENPDRVKKLFVSHNRSKFGVYGVRIAVMGIWKTIVLDDYIPYLPKESKPAFTRTDKHEIWVELLEKAWAKVHKGYLNIEAGLTRECLHDLTNCPTENYFLDEGDWFDKIVDADRNNFIMTCGSNQNAGRDVLSSIGLVGSHAYSLLGAYFVIVEGVGRSRLAKTTEDMVSSNLRRIVKLRNPWGSGEWKGDWSDSSHLWSSQLKSELGWTQEDDGIFFMSYEDFSKYFTDFQVCYYHQNFESSAGEFTSEPEVGNYFKIQIKTPGTYYFSINQPSERGFPKRANYKYSQINLVVATIEPGNKFKYVEGLQKNDREMWVKSKCSVPGTYLIYVKPYWKTDNRKFSVSVYGQDRTIIESFDKQTMNEGLILNSVYSNRASTQSSAFETYADHDEKDIRYSVEQLDDGYGYFYFENNSVSTDFSATVSLKVMKNIQLMKPFAGSEAVIRVPPGAREIVMYRVLEKPAQISYVISPKFKKSNTSLKKQCLEAGKKVPKLNKNIEDVGIALYKFRNEQEVCYLYVNNSVGYTFTEKLIFKLDGCQIDGVLGSTVDIFLNPREERLIRIIPVEGAEYYKLGLSTLNTAVTKQ